ncbi:hypothetical protein HPB49_003076 [Dermacentor silvarum]|uniref:Uncharacterized protein n=1 Tax=Dermacentor silvarum TaxID=543639 RepID=A0ACB8D244_DERSI|nr:hypothetical protein HPB49_003076 [Dermacentor silvarum]
MKIKEKLQCNKDQDCFVGHADISLEQQGGSSLSFDSCHVLKNVRSHFLAHDCGPKGEVSSCYIKKLYELQNDLVVKPVRYLSRKHVYPNNIEKTNVVRAIQVLSPDVTAALEHLRSQAGHTSSFSFADAGQTIIFMQNMYRWFVLHDTSNTTQHIHKKWADTRQFDGAEDARLEWLELTLPMHLDKLKKRCGDKKEFFTKETYEALLLTTYSTGACIKYLLTEEKFLFVPHSQV